MESEVQNNLLDIKYVDEVYKAKKRYQKGEFQYEELSRRVVISWAEGLNGQSYDEVAQHAKKFIENDLSNFYSFTKPLLNLLQQSYDRVIITNEPQFVAEPIQKIFNFNNYISTIFEVKNENLTGSVSRFNSTQTDKKKSIYEAFAHYDRDHLLPSVIQ